VFNPLRAACPSSVRLALSVPVLGGGVASIQRDTSKAHKRALWLLLSEIPGGHTSNRCCMPRNIVGKSIDDTTDWYGSNSLSEEWPIKKREVRPMVSFARTYATPRRRQYATSRCSKPQKRPSRRSCECELRLNWVICDTVLASSAQKWDLAHLWVYRQPSSGLSTICWNLGRVELIPCSDRFVEDRGGL
jgi:hypothetical protein